MQASLRVVRKALHVCRSAAEISLAFNGGKDCTALLFLVLPLWREKFPESKLNLLYIHDEGDFEEEQNFVQTLVHSYLIDSVALTEIKSHSMKAALSSLTASSPDLRMIFMGTRRTDPHGASLAPFDPTDIGWPAFVRVNPLLDWSYHDVWNFLRSLNLPFCSLYVRGFTSVGSVRNTAPNPALRRDDGSFAPAWELQDERDERKDFNRIRMNTALSDKDAFRYYRQTTAPLPQAVSGNPRKNSGFFRRTLKTRPVAVVAACLAGGLGAGFALFKYREAPPDGQAVMAAIDKLRAEFAEYEASLRRS